MLYPTTDYHRVEPVTRGERRVALFWIQSMVRDPEQRRIMTELWRALDWLHAAQPPEKALENEAFPSARSGPARTSIECGAEV